MSFLYLKDIDATIRWVDLGHGDPILFLPGLSLPVGSGFTAVAADPSLQGRRSILLDYLGSGQSDHPKTFDYALNSHVKTIIDVLDHLNISSIDVVGHSMGGTVGIYLAMAHPERVSRLVVGEGNVEPGGGVMSLRVSQNGEAAFLNGGCATLLEDLRAKSKMGAAGADRLVAGWQKADPRGLFANAKALVDLPDETFDQFAALPMPKTFVFGGENLNGETTPDLPNPERLERHGIRPLVVPDAGHAMMLDNHAGFMTVLKTALGEVGHC